VTTFNCIIIVVVVVAATCNMICTNIKDGNNGNVTIMSKIEIKKGVVKK
jgi:hypothetical protein